MSGCPVHDIKARKAEAMRGMPIHTQKVQATATNWWPNQLNLKPLGEAAPPPPPGRKSYAEEFLTLDLEALKADVMGVLVSGSDRYRFWLL